MNVIGYAYIDSGALLNLKKYLASSKTILLNNYFLNSNKNLVPPIITESMERTKKQHCQLLGNKLPSM